jgi:diguanylate cyclase (GGDEF)-like protein
MFDEKSIAISEIIDLELLQIIQDAYAGFTKASIVLVDTGGGEITQPTDFFGSPDNPCQPVTNDTLYRDFRNNAPEILKETLKTHIIHNPQAGFTGIAVPIRYKNTLIGCWLISRGNSERRDSALSIDGEKEIILRNFELLSNSLTAVTDELIRAGEQRKNLKYKDRSLHNLSDQINTILAAMYEFIDISGSGMYVVDFNTYEIVLCNRSFAESKNRAIKDCIGKPCYLCMGYHEPCPFCPREKLLSPDNPSRYLEWDLQQTGSHHWYHITSRVINWIDGRLSHIASLNDVTEQKKLQDQLSFIAYYDQRMKIPNGLFLMKDISSYPSNNSYIICFDLQGLRKINEAYGRDTGDALLEEIKSWVYRLPYYGLSFYRVEDDGFALFLQDSSEEDILKLAHIIRDRFHNPWDLYLGSMSQSVFIGISMGIVPCREGFKNYSELLNTLERIIDMARKKNDILIYNEEVSASFNAQLRLELSLKNCVLNNMEGFSVHYQPIADPVTGTWTGIEALCRWTSPELGPISPMVFIHEAEQNGLIGIIGEWVLEQSIAQTKTWGLDKLSRFVLDVNLSPLQMNDYTFCDRIKAILTKYDFPPEKLSLEITESAEVNFTEYIIKSLNLFRDAGIGLSLDDFGTGYASFSKLNTLPVNVIKLDQSFVRTVEEDEYLQHVIQIMVDFAHAAGFKVVAEGIENAGQMRILLDNQVDFFQGYLFSKPLSQEELGKRLRNFSNSADVFPVRTLNYIDINTVNRPGGGYALTPEWYQILNRCMYILNSEQEIVDGINQVLALIGKHLHVSHCYIFSIENDQDPALFEWRAQNMDTPVEYPAKLFSIKETKQALKNDGIILAADISRLNPALKELLEGQQVYSVVILPLWEGKRLFGLVGFDECVVKYREWSPQEVQLLYHVCVLIAGAYKRFNLQKELRAHSKTMEAILDQIDIDLFVSDIETGRIIFANKNICDAYKMPTLEGKRCWKVIHNGEKPCEDCPLPILANRPLGEKYVREIYNDSTKRHFQVHNSIIPWHGMEKAHMQYAIDITEVQKYQEQLKLFAAMDMFTSTLNRNTLFETLRALLPKAQQGGVPVSLCFIDLDDLKLVNDTYGHTMGDTFIKTTIDILRLSFRANDIIGRYGGDEFIVALPSCDAEYTAQKMEQALERLIEESKVQAWPFKPGFSFGIAMSDEIPYSEDDAFIEGLISLSDIRMLEQKRERKA